MEENDQFQSKALMEMSTIAVVRNRCQFCYAFFKDPEKISEHSQRCEFRFSQTFEAADGKVKFACAVCFDVFETRAAHRTHEQFHKFPGGFPCSICDEIFLNCLECVEHMEDFHEVLLSEFSSFKCLECGAFFEQESYLRLHTETDCGRRRSWNCIQCNLLTADAYKEHMKIHHKFVIEEEDAFLLPEIKVGLREGENVSSNEFRANENNIVPIDDDPLRLVLREEHCIVEGMEVTSNSLMMEAENLENTSGESSPIKNHLNSVRKRRSGSDQATVVIMDGNGEVSDIGSGKARKERVTQPQFACIYCSSKYSDKKWLELHIRKHGTLNTSISVRADCGYELIGSMLFTVPNCHSNERPDGSLRYRCECCPIYFKTSGDRMKHTETVHREKITCKICDKAFRMVTTLHAHHRAYHKWQGKIQGFVCQSCDAAFMDKNSLETHQQSECGRRSVDIRANASDDSMAEDKPTGKSKFGDEPFSSDVKNDRNSERSAKQPRKRLTRDDKKFECLYCRQKYAAKTSLSRHIIDHGPDGSLVHKCDYCPKYFKSKDDRDSHTLTEHKEKIRCHICEKTFRCIRGLTSHNRTYHNAIVEKARKKLTNEKNFKCNYCHMKYFTQKGLDAHIPNHGPDGSLVYRCEFSCSMYFKTRAERATHARAAHKDRLKCTVCGKLHRTAHSMYACLSVHRHGPAKKECFVCSKCGKSFTSRSCLFNHEKSDCGRSPIYKCEECGKTTASKGSLKTHMIVHTGDRKFSCDFCKKKFAAKGILKIHIRTHTGEKPFKCDYCEKRFVDISSKKLHSAVHTGIKRYVCYGCGDRFPTNSNLHKHRNVRKNTCALVPIRPPLGMAESLLDTIPVETEIKT